MGGKTQLFVPTVVVDCSLEVETVNSVLLEEAVFEPTQRYETHSIENLFKKLQCFCQGTYLIPKLDKMIMTQHACVFFLSAHLD